MGTNPVGDAPRTAVTDADGRRHDHPSLLLAGCHFFSTTGSANPAATLAAGALCAAGVVERDLRDLVPITAPIPASPA